MILRIHGGLNVHKNTHTHTWDVYKHPHLCTTSLNNILSFLREDRQNTLVLYFYQLLSESFLHRQWFNAYLKSGNTCHAFIDRLSVSFSGEKSFPVIHADCSMLFPPFFLILSTFLFLSSSSRSFSKLHSFSSFFLSLNLLSLFLYSSQNT